MLSAHRVRRAWVRTRSGRMLSLRACCATWALVFVACNEGVPAEGARPGALVEAGAVAADAAPPPVGALDAATPRADAASVVPSPDAQVVPEEAAAPSADAAAPDAAVIDAPSTQRASLIVAERWRLLDAGEDPFEDRPAVVECMPLGVAAETLAEERVLGVETALCGYLTALQPSQRAVAAGELLKVRLWHFELSAPEPAEAHAVVLVDGLRVLDERIPIPSPGGLLVRQLRAERAIAAGAPVHFHLHNHGANSWALVEVSTGPGELPKADAGATGDAAPP